MLHWDGVALTRMDSGTTATLSAVSGTGRNDVWAAGASGTVLHFDGRSWSAVASGTRNALAAIAAGSNGVYVAGEFGTILRALR